MTPADINPMQAAELIRRSLMIADSCVVADIEGNCPGFKAGGVIWFDIRPMLDPHELSPAAMDLNREALAYAEMRGLIARHPDATHFVRITRHP